MDELGLDVQLRVEIDRFQAAMQAAGEDLVQFGSTADRGAKRAYDSFRRLEGAFDPASRALERLQKDTAKVELAFMKGTITADRAAKVQKLLNDQYAGTITRLGGVDAALGKHATSMGRAAGSSNKMGFAIQNAGYQVGDFAVQVASGQGVLRPFIQQGTQLVSMFGPWGAVIGAAGAVVGALATTLFDTGKAADTTKASFVTLEEASERLNGKTQDAVNLGRDQIDVLLNQAKATNILSRARIESLQSELAAQERELTQHQKEIGAGQIGAVLGGSNTALNAATKATTDNINAIKDLRGQIADWLGDLDTSAADIDKFTDQLNGFHTSYETQIADNEKLAAAMGVSRREYEITKKTLEILADKGFKGTAEAARDLATKLVDTADKLKKLTDAQKDGTKAANDNSKLIERQTATFNDYIAKLDLQNAQLQNSIDGHKELNPLLQAEFDLKAGMNNEELSPEQKKQLETKIALHEKLVEIDGTRTKATKELEDQAKKSADATAKAWQHASDNIQDALADTFLNGGSFFSRLADLAKQAAAQAAAAWIIGGQNASGGFMGALQGAFGGGASVGVGGVAGGGGSGLSSIYNGASGMLNGGLYSNTMAGIGSWIATSQLGSSLGLSNAVSGGIRGGSFIGGGAGSGYVINGLGSSFSSALGNTPYGIIGSLGASALGFKGSGNMAVDTGFQLAGSIGGSMAAGALSGTAAGAMAGAWAGPIGAAVGALIGTVASGFFASKPSNKGASRTIGFAGDTSTLGEIAYNPSEKSQQNIDALAGFSDSLVAIEKQLIDITGGTINGAVNLVVGSRDGIYAGYGDTGPQSVANRVTFDRSEAGAKAALTYLIKSITNDITDQVSSEANDALHNILNTGNTDSILSGINTLSQYKSVIDALNTDPQSAAIKDQLEALTTQFDDLIDRSNKLGLSTGDLVTERDREIKAITDQTAAGQAIAQIMAANDNTGAIAIQNLTDHFADLIKQSDQLGLATGVLVTERDKEIQSVKDQVQAFKNQANEQAASQALQPVNNVLAFVKGLKNSDLSPMTVSQKAALAQTDFDRVSGLAQSGDIAALGQFNDAAQTLLQLERQLNGSGSGYLDAYNKVVQAADSIGALDPDNLIASTIESSTQTQTQTLVDALSEIRDAIAELKSTGDLNANKPAMAA